MIPLPEFERTALLLDMDGTLIDIAPTPDAVVVPAALPGVLLRLRERLGDALAVVSGRPLAQIDALLPGIPYAAAAEHGAAIRHAPGAEVERPGLPHPPPGWRAAAAAAAAAHPGAMLEDKAHGFVLHFRAAPEHGPALRAAAEALIAADPRFVVMGAKMAWEIKPAAVDKGVAVAALMSRAPFAGRAPVFVGDDVTDEDGIRVALAMGGAGLRVPDLFGSAAGVRDWLARAAAEGVWPAL